jgi:hypothetical protein
MCMGFREEGGQYIRENCREGSAAAAATGLQD